MTRRLVMVAECRHPGCGARWEGPTADRDAERHTRDAGHPTATETTWKEVEDSGGT